MQSKGTSADPFGEALSDKKLLLGTYAPPPPPIVVIQIALCAESAHAVVQPESVPQITGIERNVVEFVTYAGERWVTSITF